MRYTCLKCGATVTDSRRSVWAVMGSAHTDCGGTLDFKDDNDENPPDVQQGHPPAEDSLEYFNRYVAGDR
jgi:hypothetical protein